MTENEYPTDRPGSQLGPVATGRAACLRAGSFPSLGLRGHICVLGMVVMRISGVSALTCFKNSPMSL